MFTTEWLQCVITDDNGDNALMTMASSLTRHANDDDGDNVLMIIDIMF